MFYSIKVPKMRDPMYEFNRLRMERLYERMEARQGAYEFLSFPKSGDERFQALKDWAVIQCEVPEEFLASEGLAVAIKKTWLNDATSGTGDSSYPISSYVLDRQERERSYRDNDYIDQRRRSREDRKPYFVAYNEFESPLFDGDLLRIRKELFERLNLDLDSGTIEKHDDTYVIRLGKRRPLSINHSDICLGLFLEDRIRISCNEAWAAANTKPELYRSVIAPHFRECEIGSESPFQWAKDRVAIVNGLAQTLVGRDYPLLAAEYSYKEVARWACNLRPRENEETFSFSASEKSEQLLSCLGQTPLPEAAYLTLKLAGVLKKSDLESEDFKKFLGKLPELLNRGLNVERIVELVQDLSATTGFKSEYFSYAVNLVGHVFLADSAPWWFQENQSLIPSPKPNDWGSSASLNAHLELAELTGASYQYAKNIWERGGKNLLRFHNVDQKSALDLTKVVTDNYGIGHEQRALNVLAYARKALSEAMPSERKDVIVRLGSMFAKHRPASDIIGALEGSDANFAKPGLYALHLNVTGKKDHEVAGLLGINFSPQKLSETIAASSLPLEERAKIAPTNSLNYNPEQRFITDVSQANVLCLPVPEHYKLSGPTDKPLLTWLNYDRQLNEEVPHSDIATVSNLYLTYFAHKMPNPFAPPEGFLAFLNEFRRLREPNWQPSFMFHPNERRDVDETQAKKYMDRLAILGSWIDTAVLGMQSYEEVMHTFRWMILEQDNPRVSRDILSAEKKEIQCNTAWEYLDNYKNEHMYSKQTDHLHYERRLSADLGEAGIKELDILAEITKLQYRIDSESNQLEILSLELEELRLEREQLEDRIALVGNPEIEKRIATIQAQEVDISDEIKLLKNSKSVQRQEKLLEQLNRVQSKMRVIRGRMEDLSDSFEKEIRGELDSDYGDKRIEEDQSDDDGESFYKRRREDDLYWLETSLYDEMDFGFEDPYVDQEAERLEEERLQREEAEADPRDSYLERIEINDKIQTIQNHRFQQVAFSIEYLSCLSALAAGQVFGQVDLRTAVKFLSVAIKDGSLIFEESPKQLLGDLKRVAETLKEMAEHGIANFEQIKHDFQVFDTPTDLLKIIKDVNAMVLPYQQAKEVIELNLRRGTRYDSQREYVGHIDETILANLERVFTNESPYFVKDAARIMLNDFFWLVRYQLLVPHVRVFDAAEFPERDYSPRYETEIARTLRTGMRICGTVFLFREASRAFREEGNNPFLIEATPHNISTIPGIQVPKLTVTGDLASMAQGPASNSELTLPHPYQDVSLISKRGSDEKVLPFHVGQNLNLKMRSFRERVIECRRQDFGLLANGGKVHVIHEIDAYRLEFLKGHFGFKGTTFMLDNAKHLVTLPPTASAGEISLIAEFLNTEGIIDWEFPEIQMCIAGRLNLEHCAILGSAVMWLSNVNVPYNVNSFKTNRNDETGFRIMIYDAGGERNQFPFDISRDRGRSDMLGRRTLSDFLIYQRLGSVLSYSEEPLDGSNATIQLQHLETFHGIASQFKADYRRVLREHGLEAILDELWLNPVYAFGGINNRQLSSEQQRYLEEHCGGERHFNKAIKPVMEAWQKSEELSEKTGESAGIRAEVEAVYERLENDVRNLQQDMLEDPEYQPHRDALFNLDP